MNISFLDHILTNLIHIFFGNELIPYHGLYLNPYLLFRERENWKVELMAFANFYLEDFPNFTSLAAELDFWYNFWDEIKYKNDLPDSISATLKNIDALAFPDIYLALKLLGTFPITTCEC